MAETTQTQTRVTELGADQKHLIMGNAILGHWLAGETSVKIAKKSHLHRAVIDNLMRQGTIPTLDCSPITEGYSSYRLCNMGLFLQNGNLAKSCTTMATFAWGSNLLRYLAMVI